MITKHMLDNKEEYNDIKELEEKAVRLRKVYCKILEKLIDDIKLTKVNDFNDVNWAYKRAYRDGQIDGILKAIQIIGGFEE